MGVCAVATIGDRIALLEGANHSPLKGIDKNCGEMAVVARAHELAREFGMTIGDVMLQHLFVAGPSNENLIATSSGLATATLAPCDECRDMLAASPYVPSDLPITTIAPGYDLVVEHNRLDDMIGLYENVDYPAPSHAELAGGFVTQQALSLV